MTVSRFRVVMLAIAFALPAIVVTRAGTYFDSTDSRNKDAVLKYIEAALQSVSGTARIYCFSQGGSGENCSLRFPPLKMQAASPGKTGVDAIREIFQKDKRVTVSAGPAGMIRIYVGKMPMEVLQTRIESVTFKPEERYTDVLAANKISDAPEVKTVMQKLGLEYPLVIVSWHVQYPMKGLPHLPRSMKNVTLDQALDSVAKTFGAIVVCRECIGPNGKGMFDVSLEWVGKL